MSDIFALATQNKAEELRSMFNKGIGAKAADNDGKTLLHHAAGVNAAAVIALLLERGASLEAKDSTGLTPVMHAAKKRCEGGVITLIEHGADANPKMPDGSWLSDWFDAESFTARVLAARQVYAARTAAKSSNLLLSILNASSGTPRDGPQTPTSPGGLVSSSSSGSVHSPSSSMNALESPSSAPAPLLGKGGAKTGSTMRRSTISLKATADKDLVMSLEPTKDGARASRAVLPTPAPLMGQVPHSRRASVAYATIRPRSTLSSTEGAALREEVAAQMSRGFSSSSPSVIPSKSTESQLNHSYSNGATAAPSDAPILDPSAGAAVSTAFSTPDSKKGKKDDAKRDKKEKDKSSKKEKEMKKEKKSATPGTPGTETNKKDAKREFRRKQAEDEVAKAEARAEKTRKRKTLSFFGSKSKDSSSTPTSPKPSKSKSSTKASANTAPATTEVAPIATSSSSEGSSAPVPTTSALTTSPATTRELEAMESSSSGVQASSSADTASLVDIIPEGAVALPNGDFLVGVEADAVNLDALTDAMAKVAREVCSPLLGTAAFEIKALLEATKVLSTTLKSILSVSEVYALTLETPEAGAEFTKITESLRTETARSLVLAIKAMTVNASDVEPLKRALVELAINVARLYKCLEFAAPATVVEHLQGVVAVLRTVVSAARNEGAEAFQRECSQSVVVTMRLCSLVQDFAFASCHSVRNQRSLTDSAFALAQALRGLIISANGVQQDAKSEQHTAGLAQMLKTAAEYVRAISRTLREEEGYSANPKLAKDNDHLLEPAPQDVVLAYLRKGCGLMANAKDKYVAKCTSGGLASDEKQILNLIVTQAQLVATLMEAIPNQDMTRITQTAVSTGLSMTTLQRLLQPLLDTCMDQDLVEETVVTLENVIRCGIQVKMLCVLIASHPTSSEYRLQLAQMCQLWGIYSTLLLEAVYRALHTV